MDKQKITLLTPNQLTFLLLGFSAGPAFLRLPKVLVKTAGQDAWISAILALLYPIYVILLSSSIINKHPKENILVLSKKYLGKFLGNILNFIFMLQFLLIACGITVDFITLTTTYIVPFLSPLKIIIIGVSLAAYTAHKGLKVLGKMNEFLGLCYLFILISLAGVKQGSILNLQPVFDSGLWNILKTSKDTAFFYIGWEALLLFYPYVDDATAIKKSALKAVGIAGVIWVWSVFITIFYLGIDITIKSYWPFILVFESVKIPIINNFRYIFMGAWVLIIFRGISNYYFATAFNLNELTNIDIKKLHIYIYPLIIYLSFKLSDELLKEKILDLAIPSFIIFNLIFITLIAILASFKHKKFSAND